MSGETEDAVSGWTTDTLKSFIQNLLVERDHRFGQRFDAQEEAVKAALAAQEKSEVHTAEQLLRRTAAERDYTDGQIQVIMERLDAIDRATVLLNEQMTRVPTDVDKQVGNLKELHGSRFESVDKQFKERDTRSERESRDNKVAVDAAFAAQKEAAAKQDEANSKAIDKSEKATTETINKNADLGATQIKSLAEKIDEDRRRISAVEQAVNGAAQNRQGGTDSTIAQRASVMFGIGIVLFVITVAGFAITLVAKQ